LTGCDLSPVLLQTVAPLFVDQVQSVSACAVVTDVDGTAVPYNAAAHRPAWLDVPTSSTPNPNRE
jgi:predicted HAD superfamily phosphohydrolase YqeG